MCAVLAATLAAFAAFDIYFDEFKDLNAAEQRTALRYL